jgi:hypothetical protein
MRNWKGFVHEGTLCALIRSEGAGGHQCPEFVDEKKERMKREGEKRLKSTQSPRPILVHVKSSHIIVRVRG